MASKISNDAIEAAYEVAKRVRAGEISRTAGIEELHQQFALNRSSAGDTIANIGYMLQGQRYARKNNSFATDYFLKMIYRDYGVDALAKAVSAVEQHVHYYESLPNGSKLNKISELAQKYGTIVQEAADNGSTLIRDLSQIDQQGALSPTTKRALIDARLGQGKFRESVLACWDGRCAVTGSTTQAAIRASHIKPWRDSSDTERLDPENGLPLIANLDALFDVGLISFDSAGKLLISSRIGATERDALGLRKKALRKTPSATMANYLSEHRARHSDKL